MWCQLSQKIPQNLTGCKLTIDFPSWYPVYQWLANNCSLKILRSLKMKVKVAQSCPTICNPMDCMDYIVHTVHGVLQARILGWVGSLSLLQGIFLTQGLNLGLLHCRQILYQLNHKGSPRTLEWLAYPFLVDLPDPGIEPGSPALQVDSLPTELSGKS